MKKNLLLGLAMAMAVPAFAASPYQGSTATEGKFYLYQVESGKWLQPNMSKIDMWTTHGEIGEVGIEVELRKLENFEGYQIYLDFNNNGELNGSDQDRFFFDQGDRALCDWIFEPVTVDGVSNAYKIMIKAKPDARDRDKIAQDTYIGYTEGAEYGGLSDNNLTGTTWQLVSRADRLAWVQNEVANGPVDVTWLVPWYDRGKNNHREGQWVKDWDNHGNGSGGGWDPDAWWGYPIQERWDHWTGHEEVTLSDLPKGIYDFSIQAYYRDASIDSDGLFQRHASGTENLDRVKYYAGLTEANVMSILDDPTAGEFFPGGEWRDRDGIIGIPNNVEAASRVMHGGHYVNKFIEAPVTDGTLTVGIKKTGMEAGDWLVYKRVYLRYVSADLPNDIEPIKEQLSDLIDEAKTLPQTPLLVSALSTATDALENVTDYSELVDVLNNFKKVVDTVTDAANDIKAFYATKELGFTDAEAQAQFDAATTRDDYAKAIKTLRYARRVACAETEEHTFEGNQPAEGKFYLYNVGRKQFLQGGSDWGAHAALGLPGIELTFSEKGEKDGRKKYLIETGLYNGDANHFLGYRGYMDSEGIDNGGFSFIEVEGKPGVYNMVQGDYPDVHVAWNPYASVDAGNSDETTVGTEERNLDPQNPYAQWMLITKADRDALMEIATKENPVDVTYYIKSPNVNQRERADQVWERTGFVIWGGYGGDNRNSFNFELWDDTGDLQQRIEGLPAGYYELSCQGLYRNGTHKYGDSVKGSDPLLGQANLPQISNAYLYGGNDESIEVALPNILSETGKAPGEGVDYADKDNTIVYHIPEFCDQIQNFVRYGLYKASVKFEWNPENDDDTMPIGVYVSEMGDEPGCWTVVDNFRLYYLGNDEQNENVGVEAIQPNEVVEGPIYNLQGIQVKEASAPGIYIQNGKKFVVTK